MRRPFGAVTPSPIPHPESIVVRRRQGWKGRFAKRLKLSQPGNCQTATSRRLCGPEARAPRGCDLRRGSVGPNLLARGAGRIEPNELPDHIREKSGGKRALDLDRSPGIGQVAPSAMIVAVLGSVQMYSLFRVRGQQARLRQDLVFNSCSILSARNTLMSDW